MGFAIIKEQTAYAAGFFSVCVPKISIALLFVFGVKFGIVLIASCFTGLVKMTRIFFKQIVGR